MNTQNLKRVKWFWPWQDEKEEAWLNQMSQEGWHLKSIQLPSVYSFAKGEPGRYFYRIDYMLADKAKFQEYLQIFQDAGWEYIGEMSNYRYWRKLSSAGKTAEIYTDRESKLQRYRRLLGLMSFFLLFLVFMGSNMLRSQAWARVDLPPWISAIYLIGAALYAVIIPLYVVVVIQLLRRINQLKKKTI